MTRRTMKNAFPVAWTAFTQKVSIPVDPRLLATVDRWVTRGLYENRSQAMYAALCKSYRHLAPDRRSRRFEGHVA